MFSVSSELPTSLSVPTASSKSTRFDPARTGEQFGSLVDSSLPPDRAPAGTADQGSTPRRADSPSPARDSSARDKSGSHSGSTDQSAADTQATGNSTSASSARANDGDSANDRQPDAKSTASEQPGPKAAATDPSGSTSKDKADSTQEAATSPTAPDPAAGVIAVVIAAPATVPTDANRVGADSTAPLAMAAAGLAASASTTAQLTSPMPAAEAADGTSAAPAIKVAAAQTNAGTAAAAIGAKQDTGEQAAAVNADAVSTGTAIAAATQPASLKSSAKAQTKAATATVAAGSDAATDKTSASAPADAAPATPPGTALNTPPVVSGATAQGDADLATGKPQPSDGGPSTAQPSSPAHDHTSTTTAQNSSNPSASALPPTSTVQPHIGFAGINATASTSTLGVATPSVSAVPLSGLPIEIAASVRSGKTRFEVRLDPADLGRIDVRISVDRTGHVTSHLTVEKPETLAMLRQDAPQLQRALDDAGLKTGSNGLQFSLRDQSSSGQNNGNGSNDNSANAQRLIITEEEAAPATVVGRNYGRMLNSISGIDIRI